jgi:cyclic beta-1,2-glucan synthetase
LVIDPCIPKAWPGFEIVYQHRSARYEIAVQNPQGVSRGVALAELDGKALEGPARVPLVDDGAVHKVRVVLG